MTEEHHHQAHKHEQSKSQESLNNDEQVIGVAPAMSAANNLLASSHALGVLFENAVSQDNLQNQQAMAGASQFAAQIFKRGRNQRRKHQDTTEQEETFKELFSLVHGFKG